MSSPIIADGSWVVMSQTVKVKEVEVEVPVKVCRYCPPRMVEGVEKFFRIGRKDEYGEFIGNPQWQVTIAHASTGEIIKIRRGNSGWRVRFADRKVKENWWDTTYKTVQGDVHPETGRTAMSDLEAERYLEKRFGRVIAQWTLVAIKDDMAASDAA